MAYLKINNHDYSAITSSLKVNITYSYNSQTNAQGDTVVDVLNRKREFEITIIALNDTQMQTLLDDLKLFKITVGYLNPETKTFTDYVDCIVPQTSVEYYTIRQGNTSFKSFSFKAVEL